MFTLTIAEAAVPGGDVYIKPNAEDGVQSKNEHK
jgi:hypothetical protein